MTDIEPKTHLGSGWISGVLSAVLGVLGFGGVLCLLFPAQLTMPELREVYSMPFIRSLIHMVLVSAFVLGVISVFLRPRKTLGLMGLGFTTLAVLLGGADVPLGGPLARSPYLGLDWFLLELFFLALIFVPLERLFARLREQGVFRPGWKIDMVHFAVSHLFVQVTVFLSMLPAKAFFSWALSQRLHQAVAAQPLWLQFIEILLIVDLFEYWTHRFMHENRYLWRIHAVHHSSEHLDWLAASRIHVLDSVTIRAVTFIPLFVLGFSSQAIFSYLVFVTFHAIFIHANVGLRFGWLDWVIATPRFHHWHHASEARAVDKNYAVHLPLVDILFGTCLLPKDEWPSAYGITGRPVPESYLGQLAYPFAPRRKRAPSAG